MLISQSQSRSFARLKTAIAVEGTKWRSTAAPKTERGVDAEVDAAVGMADELCGRFGHKVAPEGHVILATVTAKHFLESRADTVKAWSVCRGTGGLSAKG